ncbi:probable cation-transporting ATPase 13A4 [Ixodes scapularis]|uniref:probable cation-transporting ATPase 13A4 n=1 Tax=Ixodes scapularis TaxID=6945 RepID=UPI001A9E566B|nr:probable cation-transporting ATPase 13A4 [Ixodes scapularis]
MVTLHDERGRWVDAQPVNVRSLSSSSTSDFGGFLVSFCYRGVTYAWDDRKDVFAALRGLDDGLLCCDQLLQSQGFDASSRRRLLDIHGSNEPCNLDVTAALDSEQTTSTTTWLFLGAALWFLRSYWMCATAAALVLLVSWLRRFLHKVLDRRWLRAFKSRNAVPVVTVVTSDGVVQELDPKSLVPGDLFLLGLGDRVPCDAVIVFGSCLVEQGDISLPPLVAKWELGDGEDVRQELFCAAKHRASTVLCGSTVLKVRGGDVIRVVALRTGAATLQASLLRRRMRRENSLQEPEQDSTGVLAQWTAAWAAFLLSVFFWLGRDRFTWDEVLLRAFSVHALLFPPRGLLLTFLLESCFKSALTSAGVTCRYDVVASTQRWGSTRAVAVDATGALCGPAEKLAGLLPAGCRGFGAEILRDSLGLSRGHPLRWAAVAGQSLWVEEERGQAMGHPHEVAAFEESGAALLVGNQEVYALGDSSGERVPPVRLRPLVNPFWSTRRLDEDLRRARPPQDVVATCVLPRTTAATNRDDADVDRESMDRRDIHEDCAHVHDRDDGNIDAKSLDAGGDGTTIAEPLRIINARAASMVDSFNERKHSEETTVLAPQNITHRPGAQNNPRYLSPLPEVRVSSASRINRTAVSLALAALLRSLIRLLNELAERLGCLSCPRRRRRRTPHGTLNETLAICPPPPSELHSLPGESPGAPTGIERRPGTEQEQVVAAWQRLEAFQNRQACRHLHVLQRHSQHGVVSAVLLRADRYLEVLVKGWPAAVLSLCQGHHDTHPPPQDTDPVAASLHERGLGLSAVAWKQVDLHPDDPDYEVLLARTLESDLNFEGFLLFEPVPRPEAVSAVENIRQADLRPVIVDEDSVYRCIAVARATGVVQPGEPVLLVAARQCPVGGPRVDVRRLETPSGLAVTLQDINSEPSRVHYALSADTLIVLREHFPDLLESLRESVSVLGGISPKDVRSTASDLNLDVVCCGGAALALAAGSPGGLALGLHGESLAAPLLCPSISCAAVLAQKSRACLVGRGLAQDFLLLSVCLQACALLILYAERATITDGMHLYLEVISCGAPTIGLAIPGQTGLADIPPQLDAPSLVIHILSWLSAQVCLLGQLHCQSWYNHLTRQIQRRVDATVVFLLAAFQLPLLALLLVTLRGGSRPRVLFAAILLPTVATLTLLLLPWAGKVSLLLGLPRWKTDRDTVILRAAVLLIAALQLLVDATAQVYLAPQFRRRPPKVFRRRIPVAQSHVGTLP